MDYFWELHRSTVGCHPPTAKDVLSPIRYRSVTSQTFFGHTQNSSKLDLPRSLLVGNCFVCAQKSPATSSLRQHSRRPSRQLRSVAYCRNDGVSPFRSSLELPPRTKFLRFIHRVNSHPRTWSLHREENFKAVFVSFYRLCHQPVCLASCNFFFFSSFSRPVKYACTIQYMIRFVVILYMCYFTDMNNVSTVFMLICSQEQPAHNKK